MNFNQTYKNSKLYKLLTNDIKNNMVKHAYILNSSDDMLLSYFAQSAAKHLVCKEEEAPCGNCKWCKKIDGNNHLDIITTPREGEVILTEEINEVIDRSIQSPTEGNVKVFILKNFDKCSSVVQNKFLKTLEEPVKSSLFILTATNLNGLLATIKSRGYLVSLATLPDEELKEIIKLNFNLQEATALEIISSCGGSLTRAINLIHNKDFLRMKDLCFNILLSMKTSADVLEYSAKMLAFKNQMPEIIDELTLLLRDISLVKQQEDMIKNKTRLAQLKQASEQYSPKIIKLITEEILKATKQINANCNLSGVCDGLLLKILEVKFKCQK